MPPYTTTDLHDRIERSASCDCTQCVLACKSMPGYLVPGDIERIAEFMGVDPDNEDFLADNFRASEGPLLLEAATGKTYRIPTIVPAQYDDNGRCVFLAEGDRCMIHQVSPYGCSRFRVCDHPSREADVRSKMGLQAITASLDYTMLWMWLWQRGLRSPSLADRKRRLQELLDEDEGK